MWSTVITGRFEALLNELLIYLVLPFREKIAPQMEVARYGTKRTKKHPRRHSLPNLSR
jgi:hypothetical protein